MNVLSCRQKRLAPVLGIRESAGADAVRQGGAAVPQRPRQQARAVRRAAAVEGAAGAGAAARVPRQGTCGFNAKGTEGYKLRQRSGQQLCLLGRSLKPSAVRYRDHNVPVMVMHGSRLNVGFAHLSATAAVGAVAAAAVGDAEALAGRLVWTAVR